jgi:hypothetical protein
MQADPEVFATAGSDRSIALYDLRHSTPVRKLVMQTKTNAIAWNPMEPLNFVVANEDCNLYSYDMRKLDTAFCVHEARPAPRTHAPDGARHSAAMHAEHLRLRRVLARAHAPSVACNVCCAMQGAAPERFRMCRTLPMR